MNFNRQNMIQKNIDSQIEDEILLKKFNNRDESAFVKIYIMFYREFMLYATTLYHNTRVSPEDAVHDIFTYIWQTERISFESITKIKAFVLVAIKNRYKNHLDHLRCESDYINTKEQRERCENNFEIDIFKGELYTILEEALNFLPHECAEVVKLYMKGYDPDEIAEKLNKKIRTVYNQKNKAIDILRKKLSKNKIFIFG